MHIYHALVVGTVKFIQMAKMTLTKHFKQSKQFFVIQVLSKFTVKEE